MIEKRRKNLDNWASYRSSRASIYKSMAPRLRAMRAGALDCNLFSRFRPARFFLLSLLSLSLSHTLSHSHTHGLSHAHTPSTHTDVKELSEADLHEEEEAIEFFVREDVEIMDKPDV